MKFTYILSSLVAGLFCAALLHGQGTAKRPMTKPRVAVIDPAPVSEMAPATAPADSEPGGRVVQYGERDIVKLKAKLRYTTLIVLPKNEKILDFVCGDKEFWVVNGAENLVYVKPAKAGAQTNLNLITASGNIYSFELAETSETADAPDLKVFVEPKEQSMVSAANASPRFVSAQDLDDFRQQAELAREETRTVKQAEQAQVDRGINGALSAMRFAYRFKPFKKPFRVTAIYHDDRATYIEARPTELPVIYEMKDGKPNLVDFDFKNGLFVVPKVLDEGYLAIGKAKLRFARKD